MKSHFTLILFAVIFSVSIFSVYGQNVKTNTNPPDTILPHRDLQTVDIHGDRVSLLVDRRWIRTIRCLEELQNARRIYYFELFTDGYVAFKDGERLPATLNYNLLSQKMEFIQNNTRLELTTPKNRIDFIQIAGVYFYPYQDRYLALVYQGEVSILACLKISYEERKHGAYGQQVSTGVTQRLVSPQVTNEFGNTTTIFLDHDNAPLNIRLDVRLWLMHNRQFFSPTRNSLIRIYPRTFRRSINDYLWKNSPELSSLEDLTAIVRHFNDKLEQHSKR